LCTEFIDVVTVAVTAEVCCCEATVNISEFKLLDVSELLEAFSVFESFA